MLKTPLLTVTVIALMACSKNGFSTMAQEIPSVSDDGVGLVLGSYKSACDPVGMTDSFDSKTTVTATEIEITNTQYEDTSCTVPRAEYNYTYTYTDVGASTSLSDTRKVNLAEGKLYLTAHSAAAVTDFNGWVQCGFNDWQSGVAKDVSGDPTCQEIPVGTITYSIARTMNDTLELGEPVDWLDPNEGTTDQLRFTVFEDPQQKQ